MVALAMNVGMFVLVSLDHQATNNRETEVQRRLVQVEAKEQQRDLISAEIRQLEDRRAEALRQAREADSKSADSVKALAERDRSIRERDAAVSEAAKAKELQTSLQLQSDTLKSNIEQQRRAADEAAAFQKSTLAEFERRSLDSQARIADLQRQVADLTKQQATAAKAAADAPRLMQERDTLDGDIQKKKSELAALRTQEEQLRATQTRIKIDESAASLAASKRTDLEIALAQKSDQLNASQQQLIALEAEIVRAKAVKAALAIDDAAAKAAAAARNDADSALAKSKGELAQAQADLVALRDDIARTKALRQSLALDEGIARQTEAAKNEAQKALAKVKADLASAERQMADRQSALDLAADRLANLRRDLEDATERYKAVQEKIDRLNRSLPASDGAPNGSKP